MIRTQKQEQGGEREVSQEGSRKAEKKRHRIKRSQKVRQITHYFSKVERKRCPNQNIPSDQRSAIDPLDQQSLKLHQQEQALAERRDQLLNLLQTQKEEREHYVAKVKAVMSQQIKKMAEIDRIFRRQRLALIPELQQLRYDLVLSIGQKQDKFRELPRDSLQAIFLQKELAQLKKQLKEADYKLAVSCQEQRLSSQEESCYFRKQKWPVLSKRYQTIKLIGKGGFSEVYEALDLQSSQKVAVKLSEVEYLLAGKDNKNDYLRHIKRQYEVHKLLSHPFIVQLIEVLQTDNAICIVLEYCQGETLARMLKRQGKLQQKYAKLILKQLLQVVRYLSLQKPSVVHYDLKPQNIMFQHGLPKVLDFGVCKTIDNQNSKMALTSQGIGTHCYLPPETFAVNNPTLSNKVDIWSIGVIFYEMLYGNLPFGHNGFMVSEQINFGQAVQVSQEGKTFIRRCLKSSLRERFDATSALKDPYLSN